MSLTQLLAPLSEPLQQMEQAILADVETNPRLLHEVSAHILQAGGKRLRPGLVLMSHQLFDSNWPAAIRAAQVVEYLHTATLLHDDVVDMADMRRKQQAARAIWGNEASVRVGDYLFSLAFDIITHMENQAVMEVISETTTAMAMGELIQLTRTYGQSQEEEYFRIIFSKTASLFAASTKLGGILGNASQVQQQALYEYGRAIGLAFQIVDDLLDYFADPEKSGKSIGTDLMERKVTLPLIHLLRHAPKKQRKQLKALLAQETITHEDLQSLIQQMKECGSDQYSFAKARELVSNANQQLDCFPVSDARERLKQLANFIVERDF